MEVVRIAAWSHYSWLRHAFSTRIGGVSAVYGDNAANLGWTEGDDPEAVAANRRRLLETVAPETHRHPLVTLRQVHGVAIKRVNDDLNQFLTPDGRAGLEGDGLVTSHPGVLLGMQTADCVPIILVDLRQRAVGVLHAGWRGTAAGMAAQGVQRMGTEFGSHPVDLVAAVGPAIGPCCYVVGEEVKSAFGHSPGVVIGDRLDLWEANRRQLLGAGLATGSVSVVAECTGCTRTAQGVRKYFSHRVDRGVTGRMMSVVGVVEGGTSRSPEARGNQE